MKKAILAALSFMLISFLLVSGTFAMPDLNEIFADLSSFLGDALGKPEQGGENTAVHVAIVSDTAPQSLYPGSTASRTSCVQNKGNGDIYFRLVYAIQYDQDTWNMLKVNFDTDAEAGFNEHDWQDINISGTPYKMKVFTYTEALAPGASSPDIQISISMDPSVTSKQFANYRSDFLQIKALAIDPKPFTDKGCTTATEALDKALPLKTLNPF